METASFYLYVCIVAGFIVWIFIRRRNAVPLRNLFANGTPSKLSQRIEVEVYVNREEFIEANVQLSKKIRGNTWTIFYAVLFTGLTAFNILTNPINTTSITTGIFLFVVFSVLIFLSGSWFNNYTLKKSSGKNYDTTPFIQQKTKYIFDAEQYEVLSPISNHSSVWSTIQGYVETEDYLMIYTNPVMAFFLPKKSFTAQDYTEFQSFLATNFEERKKY